MSELVMEMVIKGETHKVRIKDEYGVMDRSEGVMALESGLNGLVRQGVKRLSRQIHEAQQEGVKNGIERGDCCHKKEGQRSDNEGLAQNQCRGHGAGCCCYGIGTGNC
jgi:hypothetical protein